MTTPSEPEQGRPAEGVDLSKGDPTSEAPFDPYRFGRPDHPIPAEYAPPGYTGPVTPPASAYPPPAAPNGQSDNPFSNPPGTPYPPAPQQPYQYPQQPSGQYPPEQYPPAQYPPGQYPPAQYPPGQYPPGQYPPAQYPPGQFGPPPPGYHGYTQPRTGNGKAIAALVLGIASIVFCWLFFFDAIFVVPALVFALLGISEGKKPGARGRNMAIAGLVCTIIGALLATVLTVLLVNAANKCGGFSNSKAPGFNTCIRDHFG